MKKYKPGQFVSIGGRLAKVCKPILSLSACTSCEKVNEAETWNSLCFLNSSIECLIKLGEFYPKLIKQCGNQGK